MCFKVQFVHVFGMQKLMGGAAEGLAQELFVGLLYLGVLMGEAKLSLTVQTVQGASAPLREFASVVDGLSAASDTTTGACHDFHEIIGYPSCLNVLHQLLRIGQSADSTGM